jgi:hypothetical protein
VHAPARKTGRGMHPSKMSAVRAMRVRAAEGAGGLWPPVSAIAPALYGLCLTRLAFAYMRRGRPPAACVRDRARVVRALPSALGLRIHGPARITCGWKRVGALALNVMVAD